MSKHKKGETFADFLKQLQENKIDKGKDVEKIEEKQYYCIVCEGKRTEPAYFKKVKTLLPPHLLKTVEIHGKGTNTLNIVNSAIKIRDNRLKSPLLPPFDEVWAVFDKDEFPDEHFDEAVKKAEENGIEPGCTNEAFELWYVLHFQYLDTAIGRDEYFTKLQQIGRKKYGKDKKSAEEIAEKIFNDGDLQFAINSATKLEELHKGKTASASCPYTRIHHLVKKLLHYAKYKNYKDRHEA